MINDIEVNFCFRCGRNVGKQQDKCWYCAAPTRRMIRPPRRCPYCDEPIRPKAIKCHKCGEFLDQPRQAPPQDVVPQQQPTFVIEKAIIQTGSSGALTGPAHMDPSRAIEAHEVHQIEGPTRELPGPSPVAKALPGPQEPQESPAGAPPEKASPSDDKGLIPMEVVREAAAQTEANLPSAAVRRDLQVPGSADAAGESRALAPSQGGGDLMLRQPDPGSLLPALRDAIGSAFRSLRKSAPKKELEEPIEAIDVEGDSEEDRYRVCGVCLTEILVADGYCFHCGQKYTDKDFKFASAPKAMTNWVFYVLAIGSLAGFLYFGPMLADLEDAPTELIEIALGVVAPFFSLVALVRQRGFFHRLFSLALLVTSLAVLAVVILDV